MQLFRSVREKVKRATGDKLRQPGGPPPGEPAAAALPGDPPPPFRAELKQADERTAVFRGNGLEVSFRPQPQYPYTLLRVRKGDGSLYEEELYFGHLGLGRMLTGYEFGSVLEIGAGNGAATKAFAFTGKSVTAVEINPAWPPHYRYQAQYRGDYLDCTFPRPFEALWCCHVLEHQRHLGRFCEKMFDDLAEGGVLAVSVPSALSPLMIGHCNIFTPLHLIYHLILAGFDCSEARVKCYDWQFSVLVRKKSNRLARLGQATIHFKEKPEFSDVGHDPRLLSYFPREVQPRFSALGHVWGEWDALNW